MKEPSSNAVRLGLIDRSGANSSSLLMSAITEGAGVDIDAVAAGGGAAADGSGATATVEGADESGSLRKGSGREGGAVYRGFTMVTQ